MHGVSDFCVIAAGVTFIGALCLQERKWAMWVPLGLAIIALALDHFGK